MDLNCTKCVWKDPEICKACRLNIQEAELEAIRMPLKKFKDTCLRIAIQNAEIYLAHYQDNQQN
jgi:hypothetical protein